VAGKPGRSASTVVVCAGVDKDTVVKIMENIQSQYVSSVAEDGRLWVEGQIAVSQFTDDGHFYRARVLNVIDADTVEVISH